MHNSSPVPPVHRLPSVTQDSNIMQISGDLLIGTQALPGTNGSFNGIDAASGEPLAPSFGGATLAQLDRACDLAWQAADAFRDAPLEKRAV